MKELSIEDLEINPYTVFGKDWMALTAGDELSGYNTMTISWGHIGSIWDSGNKSNLPTIISYVRPSRYTKEPFIKDLSLSIKKVKSFNS